MLNNMSIDLLWSKQNQSIECIVMLTPELQKIISGVERYSEQIMASETESLFFTCKSDERNSLYEKPRLDVDTEYNCSTPIRLLLITSNSLDLSPASTDLILRCGQTDFHVHREVVYPNLRSSKLHVRVGSG